MIFILLTISGEHNHAISFFLFLTFNPDVKCRGFLSETRCTAIDKLQDRKTTNIKECFPIPTTMESSIFGIGRFSFWVDPQIIDQQIIQSYNVSSNFREYDLLSSNHWNIYISHQASKLLTNIFFLFLGFLPRLIALKIQNTKRKVQNTK